MELYGQPRCPICGSDARRRVGSRADLPLPDLLAGGDPTVVVEVVACSGCGHFYCDPIPGPTALSDLYADASNYFVGTEQERHEMAAAFMARVLAQRPSPGRLLDVGAGRGYLLESAESQGWSAVGLEPTEQFADVARAKGLTVETAYLEDLPTGDPFDVVTATAVLEHVPDPVGFLRAARGQLVRGGLVFVEVPNGRRPEAALLDAALRLRGRPWTVRTAPLQSPFHLSEFTRRSLEEALRLTEFEVVDLQVAGGRVPYPLPRVASALVRAVEKAGSKAGHGLNMTAVGRAI